jgi:hypothetical protein
MPALTSLVNPASAVITNSVEQPVPTTVSDASVALEEIAFYLGKLVKMSESSAVVDTAQRQRVSIDAAPATINATINGAINNPAFVMRGEGNSNLYQNGANAFGIFYAVPDVWKFTEAARQNYQLSIRSNLQFS